VTRALLAAIGIAAMAAAGYALVFSLPAGFPDGYVSPYDRATQIWVTTDTYLLLLAGIFTLVTAVMQRLNRATVGAVLCIVFGLSLWLADSCPRLTWCTPVLEQVGLPIDDGQGG
jgi:hypothetical protein